MGVVRRGELKTAELVLGSWGAVSGVAVPPPSLTWVFDILGFL